MTKNVLLLLFFVEFLSLVKNLSAPLYYFFCCMPQLSSFITTRCKQFQQALSWHVEASILFSIKKTQSANIKSSMSALLSYLSHNLQSWHLHEHHIWTKRGKCLFSGKMVICIIFITITIRSVYLITLTSIIISYKQERTHDYWIV